MKKKYYNHVFETIRLQWESIALLTAHKLGLFAIFTQTGESISIQRICSKTGMTSRGCYAILSTLSNSGWLSFDGNQCMISETDKAICFIDPDPDLEGYLNLHSQLQSFWGSLDKISLGEIPADFDFFNSSNDKQKIKDYTYAMNALGDKPATELLDKLFLSGTEKILDMGGGGGVYCNKIKKAYPAVSATIIERAPVCDEISANKIQNSQMEINYKKGSYLNFRCNDKFDMVLCCNILHHETSKNIEKVIETAVSCLKINGRVFIVDYFNDDPDSIFPPGFPVLLLGLSKDGIIYSKRDTLRYCNRSNLRFIKEYPLSTGLMAYEFIKTTNNMMDNNE